MTRDLHDLCMIRVDRSDVVMQRFQDGTIAVGLGSHLVLLEWIPHGWFAYKSRYIDIHGRS